MATRALDGGPRHSGYSRASILIHWTIALLIIGNLAGAFWMESLLHSDVAADKQLGFQVIQLHKATGLTVLTLSALRLLLRLREGFVPLPAHMTPVERVAARLTHYGFYVLMLGVPLLGWAMTSASPLQFPISYFGLFDWPMLPLGVDAALADTLEEFHELGAFAIIGMLALHVAGALKHHFLDRDDVLAHILPLVRPRG